MLFCRPGVGGMSMERWAREGRGYPALRVLSPLPLQMVREGLVQPRALGEPVSRP